MRRVSTQSFLFALVATVLIPALLFAAFLLTRYATTERERLEEDAAQLSRQAMLVIDAELGSHVSLLRALATSTALREGDLARFHQEAARVVVGYDEVVVLREMGPRQLLNTQLPFGTELPPAVPIAAAEQEQLVAGRPVISRVYKSPVSGEARIAVALPLRGPQGEEWVLAATVPTSRFRDVLAPAVPPGWVVGIGDHDGAYVTRSARHEEVTGTPGLPEYIQKVVGRTGTFTSRNFEGIELLAGYYRSDFSGWFATANIPRDMVEAPLRSSLITLAGIGVLALAISALLAFIFGKTFTAAATGLAARAELVGHGQAVTPLPTALREPAVVSEALVAAGRSVDARLRAEADLRRRTGELESVLATVPAIVLFTYDPAGDTVVQNQFAAELVGGPAGLPDGNETRPTLREFRLFKDDHEIPRQQIPLRRAARGERVTDEEMEIRFDDGRRLTILANAAPLRGESGDVVGAVVVAIDITERRKSEEARRLLTNELNHRVKNTLAIVQSVAMHTLRGASDVRTAEQALSERLVAMARAHDILTRENWVGADLRQLAAGAIAPHGGDRVRLSGPAVWLPPSLSLSLSLALHELAANAVKYGALSTATGSVDLSWTVRAEESGTRLAMSWKEEGGPPVSPPTRQGFGSRLIKRSLSAEIDGEVEMDFAPGGLRCRLEATIRRAAPPARDRA